MRVSKIMYQKNASTGEKFIMERFSVEVELLVGEDHELVFEYARQCVETQISRSRESGRNYQIRRDPDRMSQLDYDKVTR